MNSAGTQTKRNLFFIYFLLMSPRCDSVQLTSIVTRASVVFFSFVFFCFCFLFFCGLFLNYFYLAGQGVSTIRTK